MRYGGVLLTLSFLLKCSVWGYIVGPDLQKNRKGKERRITNLKTGS